MAIYVIPLFGSANFCQAVFAHFGTSYITNEVGNFFIVLDVP